MCVTGIQVRGEVGITGSQVGEGGGGGGWLNTFFNPPPIKETTVVFFLKITVK